MDSNGISIDLAIIAAFTKVGSFVHGINFLRLLESELKVAQKFFFGDVCDNGSAGTGRHWELTSPGRTT